jgi:tRNA(fMet)-specific endonuclease VapC
MIPADALVLLDTNILVHLIRQKELGKRIEAEHNLHGRTERPLISVVTIGEAISLARKFGWGIPKQQALRDLLHELVVVDINREPILERYGEIDHFSESNGRSMGKNDVWIAATAAVTGAWLITTDKDFDHLDGVHLNRVYVDPNA